MKKILLLASMVLILVVGVTHSTYAANFMTTLSATTPKAGNVNVGQKDVELAHFLVINSGSSMKVTNFNVVAKGTAPGGTLTNVALYDSKGTKLASPLNSTTGNFNFTNSKGLFTVNPGSGFKVFVKADILATAKSGYTTGVAFANGTAVDTFNKKVGMGSAVNANLMTLANSLVVTQVSSSTSNTTDANGNITSVTYTIPVTVTSYGNKVYMGQTGQLASVASSSNSFAFVFEDSTNPNTAVTSSMTSKIVITTTDAAIETNSFRLDSGVTKHFTIAVTMTDPSLCGHSYRVRLAQIRTAVDSGLSKPTNMDLVPQSDFRTSYQYFNCKTTKNNCSKVSQGTPSYTNTLDNKGLITDVNYSIPLTITNGCGNDVYLAQAAQLGVVASASNSFAFVFENSSAPTTAAYASMTASSNVSSSDASVQGNSYRIEDGVTRHFTIKVSLITPPISNSSFRVRLNQIRTYLEAGLARATNADLLPQTDFRTGYRFINY